MVKIDKTELLRSLVILEIALVVIPVTMFWSLVGILALFADIDITTLNLCCALLLFSIYFIPPKLIAPGLFQGSLIGVFPEGLAGWLVAIFMYSFIAFLLALASSLYTPLNRWKKSSVKHVSAQDKKEIPCKH